MQKKELLIKLMYSIKINMIASFSSKFFVNFLKNSKIVYSSAVFGALSGALKVTL